MVLSFGALGDAIDDELAGYDGAALVTQHTPESTVPLAMIGPTTSVPTGSLSSSSSSGGFTDFLKTLGVALLGTTAKVTTGALTAKSPAEQLLAQQQAAAAAAASRNQMLLIGGVVLAVVVGGAFLLRGRSS